MAPYVVFPCHCPCRSLDSVAYPCVCQISIPLTVALLDSSPLGWFESIIDALFLIDVIINFRTGVEVEFGSVSYHQRTIARRYLTGWFTVDLLATIPFEEIIPIDNVSIVSLLKVPRLLRVGRLMKKFQKFAAANGALRNVSCEFTAAALTRSCLGQLFVSLIC